MAFNKAKVLHDAENLVSQGKISQAIKRYFDVFDKDPSEIILLNTIGDLYVRDKNVPEGLKLFYTLAEAYLRDGFTVKAIAIYKKIVKLEPDPLDPLLKLAELFQSQRLIREAREVYFQVVDYHKRKNQNDNALETLRTIVQLDVENPNARARLAAFCEETGRKDEALKVYLETAELAHGRGDTEAAQAALEKARELNPDDPQMQLLRARIALALKNPEEVEAILSAAPGLKDDPAGRSLLIDTYLAMQQPEKAEALVLDLFRAAPRDYSPLASFVTACVNGGQFDAAMKVLAAAADELIKAGDTSSLMDSLRLIRSKSPQHLPALELMLRIDDARKDESSLPEILTALGQAYMQRGQFEKAEQLFQRLVSQEPENDQNKDLLAEAREKQGKEYHAARLTAQALGQEKGATASTALAWQAVDREAMVKEALENSDLLARYHLLGKAVAQLEKVLEFYPDETEVHRRLVGMCWKDMPERAERSAQALARIYAQQGDVEGARRFAQIAGTRETAPAVVVPPPVVGVPAASPMSTPPLQAQPAGTSGGEVGLASDFSLSPIQEAKSPPLPHASAAAPALEEVPLHFETLPPPSPPLAPSPELREIDLSQDWESFLAEATAPTPAPEAPPETASPNYDDSRVEVFFYLDNGLLEEARQAVSALEKALPGDPRVAELRALVETRTGPLELEIPARQPTEPPPASPVGVAASPAQEAVVPAEPAGIFVAPEPEPQPSAVPSTPSCEDEIPTEPAPEVSVETALPLLSGLAETVASTKPEVEPSPLSPPPSAPTQEPAMGPGEEIPTEPSPAVRIEAAPPLPSELAETLVSAQPGSVEPSPLPPPPSAPTQEPAMGPGEEIPTEPSPAVRIEAAPPLPNEPAETVVPAQPESLEHSPLLPPASPPAEEPAAGLAASAGASASPLSVPLEGLFEAPAAEPVEEDPETHYYLGVAYWEMDLLDEAIGEFQKVVKGAGKGPYPPNYLQACTLLATCFLAKGMAPIAIKWYWRALETPDLDEDAWLALQYDLGAAYEQAGDLPHAFERFSEVYGQNIDFRDVAEKIRTLQQKGS